MRGGEPRARYSLGDRWAFVLLCICVLSQGYSLPVLRLGPSWAVWPTPPILSAIAFIALAAVNRQPMWRPLASAARAFALFLGFCLLSLALVTIASHEDLLPGLDLDLGFALYQVWIMALGLGVLWAASTIRLDEHRVRILGRVTLATLLWIAITVALTYQNFVSPRVFAPQLPANLGSGPFLRYLMNWEGVGLGTISYNHAYAGSVILILAALWVHLAPRGDRFMKGLVLSIATLVMFLTGSRAGLAAFVVFFAVLMLVERSKRMIVAPLVLAPLAALALLLTRVDVAEIVDRQAELLETPTTETLSERDVIWKSRVEFLGQDGVRWLIGTGFGSAPASGDNAHNMYLHVIVEMGVIGLAAFAWLFAFFAFYLRRQLPRRPAFLVATLCLLFSSLTQETLYPVAAQGFTLPLFLLALAIAVRAGQEPVNADRPQAAATTPRRRAARARAPTYARS